MMEFSARKDQRLLADLLLDIEQTFDVETMYWHRIPLWPLIRLMIGRAFKKPDQLTGAGLRAAEGAEEATAQVDYERAVTENWFPSNVHEREALLRAYRATFDGLGVEDCQELHDRHLRELARQGPVDYLVLSKIEKYYSVAEQGRYAPIIDPVFEDLQEHGHVRTAALEPLTFPCCHEPIKLTNEPFLRATTPPPLDKESDVGRQVAEINAYVKQISPEYSFVERAVFRRAQRILHRAAFFREAFQALNPKAIFLSSFTGWLHAVLAARALGIPVIDIQHGGQGPIAITTTQIGKVPRQGYATYPDIFWLWGRMNYGYLTPWFPGGSDRHWPMIGGNRKVAHWMQARDAGQLNAQDQAFVERHRGGPNVLVTLSYGVSQLMPDPLIDAMRQCPEAIWHIRLHPLHRSPGTIAEIADYLTETGVENVLVEEPTKVELMTAVSVAKVHLTPFSTSGTEASGFGVPTLICSRIGARLFDEEIEKGVFACAETADGIAEWVRAGVTDTASRFDAKQLIEVSDEAVTQIVRASERVPQAEDVAMINEALDRVSTLRS